MIKISRQYFVLVFILTLLPVLVGGIVLFGWYTKNLALIQILPSFAPMQYNTALCFILAGVGTIAFTKNRFICSALFGFFVSLLSGLTLAQYILATDFGIDQFFMDAYVFTKTTHPGRMAPNTALCFFLIGLPLLFQKFRRQMALMMGAAVLSLSLMSLASYFFTVDELYGLGSLTRMALHTALCFTMLGGLLFFLGVMSKKEEATSVFDFSPFVLAGIVAALTVFSWHSIRESSQARNQEYFNQLVADTADNLADRYRLYEQSLIGGLGVFYASNNVDRQEWNAYVDTLRVETTLPGINGIGYIDYVEEEDMDAYIADARADNAPYFINHPATEYTNKFIIKFIEPESINREAVGLDIGFENNRRQAAEEARDRGLPVLTRKIELVQDKNKEAGFLLLLPFYDTKGAVPKTVAERRKYFKGWVYAPFIGRNFLNDIAGFSENQIGFDVYDGSVTQRENLIYSVTEGEPLEFIPKYSAQTKTNFGERDWTINWYATPDINLPSSHTLSSIVMVMGMIFSFLIYLYLSSLIKSKQVIAREIELQTQALKNSNDFLSLMMNSIPDLVFVKDEEFKIIRANQAFLGIYPPQDRDSIIGSTTVEKFSKEEAEVFLEQDKLAFKNGISQAYEEIELYNGKKISLNTTKVKFTDQQNKEYILCVGRDVSELIETQRSLEDQVEERTKKYKLQKNIAEAAGQAKEEFLANMSHELRTPLNSIIGLTQIILDENKIKEQERDMLKVIDRASNSLLKTVNDILDISKIESGQVKLELSTFNMPGILLSLVEQVQPLAEQKGLEIRHNLKEGDALFVIADEHRVARVFMNIIGNAVKYTNKGHVEIMTSYNPVADSDDEISVTVSIKDTGVGIAAEQKENIFDKFAQADKSTERLYGGTGLGLSITRELVLLMDGTITVESELNQGACFTVTIPMKKSSESDVEKFSFEAPLLSNDKKSPDEMKPVSTATFLVAEDHELNQAFVRKLLGRLGCEDFVMVNNGFEAFEEYKTNHNKYDFVLMDYHMPKMNGHEATSKIRNFERDNKLDHIPVMAMTADVIPGTAERCLKVGMNEYIAKPVREEEFRQKIAQWFIVDGVEPLTGGKQSEGKDDVVVDLTLLQEYTDDDVEEQKRLIKLFIEGSLQDLQKLKGHCDHEDKDEWERIAHSMKGSASYVGAVIMQDLCAKAQAMVDESVVEKNKIYEQIAKARVRVVEEFKTLKLFEGEE